MKRLEQALAVQAQVHFFGIDHHVVKEGIDRGTQRGQGLQAGGVITRFELRFGFGQQPLHDRVQALLGIFLQQRRVDVGVHLPGFFEDVADALVGRSQRRACSR